MKKLLYVGVLLAIYIGKIQAVVTVAAYAGCDTVKQSGYVYAYAQGGTAPYTYNWSNGGTGSYLSGLSNATYTLTVTDAKNVTATSTVTVKCQSGTSTGMNNVSYRSVRINVYPNPAINTINISYEVTVSSSMVNIEVYDILGNKVAIVESLFKQAGAYQTQLNVEQFTSGIYLVKLSIDGQESTERIVVQK